MVNWSMRSGAAEHNDPARRVLVVGYGNPLRGDDGLGWHAAHQLQQASLAADTMVLACHQLTPELAAPVGAAALVVFIDARCADPDPDDDAATTMPPDGVPLTCQQVVPDPLAECSLTHHLTPAALLACASLLYGTCPRAVVFSAACSAFDLGEEMSTTTQALLPALLEEVTGYIAAWHSQHAPSPAN